jgi:uncharacterized protein YfaS (alpha-2-macroglobulin family)
MQRLQRRSLLAGLAASGAGLLAGCPEGNDDDSSSGKLRFEQVRLLDDDPAGYGNYANVLSETYQPGDRLRLYLAPAGVSTATGDGGAETYDLTARVTVRDPNGVPIEDGEDVTINANDAAEDLGDLYLLPTIPLSLQAVPGTYTAEIELMDEHAGTSVTRRTQFEVTGLSPEPLAIDRVEFVAEPASGYRQYQRVEQSVYEPGEPVRLYVEPRGVEPVVRDEPRPLEYELDLSLLLLPPDDAEIDGKEVTFSGAAGDRSALSKLFFTVSYQLPRDVPAGEYQLRVDLTDRNAEADASQIVAFQVE